MTHELKRLLDETDSAFTRELLSSAAEDSPEPGAKRRVRSVLAASTLGLGVLAGHGLKSSVTASVTGATSAPAGAGAAAAAAGLGGVGLKWSGMLAVALATGVAGTAAYVAQEEPVVSPSITRLVVAPPPPSVDVSVPEIPRDSPEVTTSPSAPTVPTRRPVVQPPIASERPVASNLAGEIAAMDAARRGLAHGDRGPLESYLASYPRGAFREQGLAMRVRALSRAGQQDQARAQARAFLNAYPRSADAPSMRRLLGE